MPSHPHDPDPHAVNSLVITRNADPVAGRVRWDPVHSLWNGGMTLAAVVLGPLTFSWSALGIFLLLAGATLLLGHSLGYHRLLIHRSFACPKVVERILLGLGAAVGMAGPFWMIRAHDTRDWGQRQPDCHPALRHGAGWLQDYVWNLHCRLELDRPPTFAPPPGVADDPWLRFLERSWMLHQLPIALGLYLLGGWSWVVWGVCVRIAASVNGHWVVGRFAHRYGPQSWIVDASGVQAFDVPWAAIPTMGEAWHNNHHAYPGSARMGLYPGQADWGYRVIQLMQRFGLAWDVQTPETLGSRSGLTRLTPSRPASATG